MLATQQIAGNNSGPFLRQPKIVVMHATRSGIASKTDAQELTSTLNWFVNPKGASSHWVISEKERVRVVTDDLIAWHSTYLNGRSWGIELTQPTIDRPFRDGHYANAALVGRRYVSLGVAPVWLSYWDGGDVSGFVAHQDTKQGLWVGKTDPGPEFDRVRFIASLEDDMDWETFVEWTHRFIREVPAQARDGGGKPVGSRHPIGEYLGNIRDISAREKAHAGDAAKHGGGGYSDAQAVKAVKDKL